MSTIINTGKGTHFFADIYDAFTVENIRKTPCTTAELKKAGLTDNDISTYYNSIKKLYSELLFNRIAQPNTPFLTNTSAQLWDDLYNFCLNKKLVMEFADEDGQILYRTAPTEILYYDFYYSNEKCPDFKIVKTFDDFRMAVEIQLADLSNDWYLSTRYDIMISYYLNPSANYGVLVKLDSLTNKLVPLSENEALSLLKRIKLDLDNVSASSKFHDLLVPPFKASNSSMSKQDFLSWYNERNEWLRKDEEFYNQYQLLSECEELVSQIIDSGVHKGIKPTVSDDTLYVHKGNIKCQKDRHHIEQAIAILMDKNGNDVQLNVDHCTECNKFFIDYDIYQHYRKKYGSIIGNVRITTNGEFYNTTFDLAEESSLKLCGYSVNQKENLSQIERQHILEGCIESGAMSKKEVINLLRWFIDVNGAKRNNDLALKKWTDDLDFVLALNKEKQNKFRIGKIVKYNRNRFILAKS